MTVHFAATRVSWLGLVGLALVSVASLQALSAADPARLGANLLAVSRGANQNLVLTQSSCNQQQPGNAGQQCQAQGNGCSTCTTQTYPNVTGGANGGYSPGTPGAGSCGNNVAGSCDATLQCDQLPGLKPFGPCNNPIGPPVLQL